VSLSAERKRAGFVLSDRLWVGMYGETFQAAGTGRRDLHALIVDPRIAGEPGVARVLLDEAVPALRAVHHRGIVGTVAAVRDAGDLVVITEEVPESASLHELLAGARATGVRVTAELAAAIGRAIVDAAATIHAAGVVHGAIHPRSVLVDVDGNVRLADLAIGRATTTAVTRGASQELLRGLAGYVPPDIALGDEPTPASDVHAIGALLYVMLSGELPPGTLHTTPAVERLVQRSLDTDLTRRFQSAIELQENLAEALEDDRWGTASQPEIARFVARARRGDPLDAGMEDLLASLGGPGEATGDAVPALELGGGDSAVTDVDAPIGALDAVLADLDDGDEPLTEVDGADKALRGGAGRDPISEMLAIERARTGKPLVDAPLRARSRSGEHARRIGSPRPTTPPDRARSADDFAARPVLQPPRRLANLVWLVVLLAAGAALVWVILDLRDKGREQHARDLERQEAKQEKERELAAELADPGAIRIRSEPGEAAVWLQLGRTPTDSFALPTGQLHELRLELDGYQPQDVAVAAADWKGEGDARRASLAVTLQPGEPAAAPPPMPEWPAEKLAGMQRGFTIGRGTIHVESTPGGAAVWLLVGKSNTMRLEGIEAGRDYELKILKKGYTPGYVSIKAEDWREGGDPRLPLSAAPKRALLERSVTLVALPETAKKAKGR